MLDKLLNYQSDCVKHLTKFLDTRSLTALNCLNRGFRQFLNGEFWFNHLGKKKTLTSLRKRILKESLPLTFKLSCSADLFIHIVRSIIAFETSVWSDIKFILDGPYLFLEWEQEDEYTGKLKNKMELMNTDNNFRYKLEYNIPIENLYDVQETYEALDPFDENLIDTIDVSINKDLELSAKFYSKDS